MKRILIAAFLLWGFAGAAPPARAQVGVSISFGDFYASLDPYGEWVWVDHDVYAWRPGRTVEGWMPYAYGRWVWSRHGWYWVSEEPWAWAVYHYGRWHYDDYYGWIWVPGYDWAPAWVEWRYGPEYVGWAPLGPYALFDVHRGVHYSRAYRAPYDHWMFVDHGSMTRADVWRYRCRGDEIRRVYGASRYTGSVRYRDGAVETRGPEREYVERRGNLRIGTAEIVDVNDYARVRATRQGERERIDVYRPQVQRAPDSRSARPDRITRGDRSPSIESRYLDRRMRPATREKDRSGENRGSVVKPRDERPPDARPRERKQTQGRESQPAARDDRDQREPRER
jgi:hypothetical protein